MRAERKVGAGRPPAARRPSAGRRKGAKPQNGASAAPQKLQKILAQAGLGSRREIEEWIVGGRISVNGKPAHTGQRVGPEDRVRVNGRQVELRFAPRLPRVLLYNKPEGEIVSRDDPQERPSVFDRLPGLRGGRWVAVGRLDFNSAGLMVFTTSGELANRLMHPRHGMEREYVARVIGELSPEQQGALLDGVELEEGSAKFMSLAEAGGTGTNRWYRLTLGEGRNREVRRMFDAVGVMVSRLIRVRHGPLSLPPRLRRGMHWELGRDEVVSLVKTLGLTVEHRTGPGRKTRPQSAEREGPRFTRLR